MAGRIVVLDTDWQSLTNPGSGAAAIDLIEAKLGTGQWGFIHSALILQHSYEAITKLEQVKVAIKRATGSYNTGTGGLTGTFAHKNNSNDAANGLATFTIVNDTIATAGSGTLETLMPGVFNVSAGEWERTYIPELRPSLAPSEAAILSIEEALEETMTVRGILILELFQ